MTRLRTIVKKFGVGLVVSFMVAFSPAAAAHASAEVSPNDTSTPPATTQTTGVQTPTGADASTYTYNEATGNWENEHYIWNPSTGLTTAKDTGEYTYHPETGTWSTSQWQYDGTAQTYQPVPEPTVTPTSVLTEEATSSTELNNNLASDALTGDATVTGNTSAGSATSGNANAVANVINLLQSSYGSLGSDNGVVVFMANIPGDVTGNLMIDPGVIAQNQGTTSLQAAQAVEVNNQEDGTINNAIVLNASSGDAGVIANTSAGSATSGDANAVANVVNLMNSSIGANQSFIGAINIQGDLSGDILFPVGFLDSLIASNAVASSPSETSLTNNVNQAINNNISATATSGQASVNDNTSAGSSTSGKAQTTLTVMNLTGSDIIGANALLVFVNVGGTWTGVIMNAPGSTVAALGGGISQDTTVPQTFDINNNVNQAINNNIEVTAQSGDATVSRNTLAGDATSGDASATVNLANFLNSRLSLSQWFGVLFINILGDWNGSFGSAQPPAATPQNQGPSPVFSFTPTSSTASTTSSPSSHLLAVLSGVNQDGATATTTTTPAQTDENKLAVLGDTTTNLPLSPAKVAAGQKASYNFIIPAIGLVLGALLLGSDQILGAFRKGKLLFITR